MKGEPVHMWKRLIVILIIAVMGALTINNIAYIHVHVLPDGTMVTHAHPFNKKTETEQGTSHTHSQLGFLFFQHLQVLFLILAGILCLRRPVSQVLQIRTSSNFCYPAHLFASLGRAPPVMV